MEVERNQFEFKQYYQMLVQDFYIMITMNS